MYVERFYRQWVGARSLSRFEVKVEQSDLLILCEGDLEHSAHHALCDARAQIENYIEINREFGASMKPVDVDEDAAGIVRRMGHAGRCWNVGPMAAVAGAVSQYVGESLLEESSTVIVENGGDVFLKAPRKVRFALYAGEDSPFKDRVSFEVDARGGLGVCTSSGRVGPSISFGKADAVVAIADDAAFADAAATAIANRISKPADVPVEVDGAKENGALRGLVACCGDRLGIWGDVELV